jgi:hypothetical protein
MKITSAEYLEQVRTGSKATGPDQEDRGFSKLLEGEGAKAGNGAAAQAGPGAAGVLENAALVGRILANQTVGDKAATVDSQLNRTLDKMEHYAAALGDSRKSLREVEPLAQDLEAAAGKLSELSKRLPDDSPLKGLSNDAAVLATVEAMKFKRGDYV